MFEHGSGLNFLSGITFQTKKLFAINIILEYKISKYKVIVGGLESKVYWKKHSKLYYLMNSMTNKP